MTWRTRQYDSLSCDRASARLPVFIFPNITLPVGENPLSVQTHTHCSWQVWMRLIGKIKGVGSKQLIPAMSTLAGRDSSECSAKQTCFLWLWT